MTENGVSVPGEGGMAAADAAADGFRTQFYRDYLDSLCAAVAEGARRQGPARGGWGSPSCGSRVRLALARARAGARRAPCSCVGRLLLARQQGPRPGGSRRVPARAAKPS